MNEGRYLSSHRAALAAVLAALFAVGCGGGNVDEGADRFTATTYGGTIGLGFTFTTRTHYRRGEPVLTTFVVSNRSEIRLRYEENQSTAPYQVRNTAGEIVWLPSGTAGQDTPPLTTIRLQPGESKTYVATWDQKDTQSRQVPPGAYRVYAFFPGGEASPPPPDQQTVRLSPPSPRREPAPITITIR